MEQDPYRSISGWNSEYRWRRFALARRKLMLMCETKGNMGTGTCNLGKAVIFRLFTPKGLIFIFIFYKIGNHIYIEGKVANRNRSSKGG